MNRAQLRERFLTLQGHVLVIGVPSAVIMLALEFRDAYLGHWLTWGYALKSIAVFSVCFIAASVAVWFTLTRPMLNMQNKK